MSHGTGIGFSSTAAFWIPEKPPEVVPAPQRAPKTLGRPPKLPDGSARRGASERLLGGKARRENGRQPPNKMTTRSREEHRSSDRRDRDSDDERDPPQVGVALAPCNREPGSCSVMFVWSRSAWMSFATVPLLAP